MIEGAVRKLKGNPQRYTPPKGSPVEVDACAIVEKADLSNPLGASPKSLAFGLHACSWSAQSMQMQLDFKTARIPKDNKFDDKQTEVDLGGVPGYQVFKDGAFPSCDVTVVRTKDANSAGEIAQFTASGARRRRSTAARPRRPSRRQCYLSCRRAEGQGYRDGRYGPSGG